LESEGVGNLKREFTEGGGGAAKIESLANGRRLAEGTDDRFCNGGDSDGAKSHIGAAGNGEETAREPRQRGAKELGKLSGGGVPFAVDEGWTEYGGCQAAVADNFLSSPFCLVVVGGGVGTGAERADVKEARDSGGTGSGHHMGGSLKMNTGKGLRAMLSDDPDGVDDGLGVLEGVAEGGRLGDVSGKKFHVCRKIGIEGTGEGSDGKAFGTKSAANFAPDKAGSTCYYNHMPPMLEEVVINTRSHTEFVPLAQILEEAAARRGWRDGLLHVVVPHTTAGVTIQEGADPDVRRDMAVALERAVPWESREYRHGEGNTAAHVKAAMVGNHLAWPIEKGRLKFGTWQMIYFCEFDGPRERRVWVGFHPLASESQSKIS
jgi:secondary thiamine-phosphate synthase enzyme